MTEGETYEQCLDSFPGRASGELAGYTAEVAQAGGSPAGPGPSDQEAPGSAPAAAAQQQEKPCKSGVTRGRSICVAIGDDCCTEKVLKYVAKYIAKAQDKVALVHATCSSSGNGGHSGSGGGGGGPPPPPPLLQRSRDTLLQAGKVVPENVWVATVPCEKGHVGAALVAHCLAHHYEILVMGSRGISGMKAALQALVGEGSVSRYCTDHLPKWCSVVVVKPPQGHDWGPK